MDENYMDLYEKLSRLQWLLQRHHMMSHAEHGPMADPTRGQGRVLAILKLQPEITTKELSYLLGIRQQSLNELLNKLEKSGYVSRTPSEADKRVMMVRLTEKGKAAQQKDADYSSIFDCLNDTEQTAFGEYLDRVIAALEAQLGDESDEAAFEWMKAVRERMGPEHFERLMAMKRGGHPFREGFAGFERGFCGGSFTHGFHPQGPDGCDSDLKDRPYGRSPDFDKE